MSIEEVSVERFAERLHHYHQALGTDFESQNFPEKSWEELPGHDRGRLVAAARLALQDLEADDRVSKSGRSYFAKPGEAEWGC